MDVGRRRVDSDLADRAWGLPRSVPGGVPGPSPPGTFVEPGTGSEMATSSSGVISSPGSRLGGSGGDGATVEPPPMTVVPTGAPGVSAPCLDTTARWAAGGSGGLAANLEQPAAVA